MTTTLAAVFDRYDLEALADLDLAASIPLVDFARQGDVLVVPERLDRRATARMTPDTAVPPEGIAVVRGEFGGHTHLLVAEGRVLYDARDPRTGSVVAAFEVADGATAYLLHPEHGGIGFVPGSYTVRRQREWDTTIRFVAD